MIRNVVFKCLLRSRCAVTAFALGTSQYSGAFNCDHPIIASARVDHTIVHKSVKVLCEVGHAEHHQLSTPFGALKSECLANPILSPLSHKLFTDSEGSRVRCSNDILKSEQRPSYHHCWNSVHGAGKDQLNFYIRAPYGHILQIQIQIQEQIQIQIQAKSLKGRHFPQP